jgi:hypothetical protein
MILDIDISFLMDGNKFNPYSIEKDYKIQLTDIKMKGSLGKKGRYKNKPLPSTSAYLRNIKEEGYVDYSEIKRIAAIASKIHNNKQRYNIEHTSFDITFYYCAQCSLSFDKKELKEFIKLDDVSINCVRLYDYVEIEAIDEFSDKIWLYNNDILENEIVQKYRNARKDLILGKRLSIIKFGN